MKLVLFQTGQGEPSPGVLTERGVVDISGAVAKSYTPQLTMQGIIDDFDRLRPALEKLATQGEARPLDSVRLRPPLPRQFAWLPPRAGSFHAIPHPGDGGSSAIRRSLWLISGKTVE